MSMKILNTLKGYIEMLSGEEFVSEVSVVDKNTIQVRSEANNFTVLAISWCNYMNCIGEQAIVIKCRALDEKTVTIAVYHRGSVDKNICYDEETGKVKLYKVYKHTSDISCGKYKKEIIGYEVTNKVYNIITKEYETVSFLAKTKGEALVEYKRQIRNNNIAIVYAKALKEQHIKESEQQTNSIEPVILGQNTKYISGYEANTGSKQVKVYSLEQNLGKSQGLLRHFKETI